jgi:flagellar basal body rod protein FlgG
MTVLSAAGNPVRVDANGVPEQPAIYNFSNASGLSAEGENLYTTTNTSGNAQLSREAAVSGGLEGSNVNLSEEMVNMITSQRGLQLNSRLVQTADSIESMVNELNR